MSALNGAGKVVELLDGPIVVKFDVNRLIEIEEEYGSLPLLFAALEGGPMVKTIRFLLWVALDRQVPLKDVGARMAGQPVQQLAEPIIAALGEAVGASPDAEPAPADPTPELVLTPSASS
jgi:hypothetical protein